MSTSPDAYALLRDVPVMDQQPATSVPTEAKRLREWIEAMPRANLQVAQAQLRDALVCLARQRMDGKERLASLEMLRSPLGEVVASIETSLAGSMLPLSAERERQVQDAEFFHVQMGHGYRRVVADLCAPAGKLPFLGGGNVAMALGRALGHYVQALRLAWRTHRSPADGCWQGLHRCHGFVQAQSLGDKKIDDPLRFAEGSLGTFYLAPQLAALGNPYSQSPQGQDMLWQLALHYAPQCRLLPGQDQGDAFPAVPRDEDQGPGAPGERPADAWRIDPAPMLAALDVALEQQQGADVVLGMGRARNIEAPREVLDRLRRAFAFSTGRGHERLGGGHAMESVIGMSALHWHLAGGQDIDGFLRAAREQTIEATDRAAWTQRRSEDTRAPVVPVEVVDQGTGGYQLRWDSAAQARVRVGEILGLCPATDDDTPRDWMLGLIRWLKNEESGGVLAGVQLLARRARAVAVQPAGSTVARRALALEAGGGRNGVGLLAPEMREALDAPLELVLGNEDGLFDELSGLDAAALRARFGETARFGVVAGVGEYVLLGTPEAAE